MPPFALTKSHRFKPQLCRSLTSGTNSTFHNSFDKTQFLFSPPTDAAPQFVHEKLEIESIQTNGFRPENFTITVWTCLFKFQTLIIGQLKRRRQRSGQVTQNKSQRKKERERYVPILVWRSHVSNDDSFYVSVSTAITILAHVLCD